MSLFTAGASSYPAFSGLGDHINRRISACIPGQGPIPQGRYYILNRQSGGRLGWLYDRLSGRSDWFALYADDEEIDDFTDWCEDVIRGRFRLHPRGPRGISEGCIVIDRPNDFQLLGSILRSQRPFQIPGTELSSWGVVTVR